MATSGRPLLPSPMPPASVSRPVIPSTAVTLCRVSTSHRTAVISSNPAFLHPCVLSPPPFVFPSVMALWLSYFELLCNITVLLLIVFTALSYATGLFYLAELAEEFPTLTKRLIIGLLIGLGSLHLLGFVFSPLSKWALLLGLATHLSYYRLLSNFPYLPLTSLTFFLSLLLLISSQVLWYIALNSTPPPTPYSAYPRYSQPGSPYYHGGPQYTTAQQMAFYFLFIWLVPLIFFIAGSVSSQALPQVGGRGDGEEEGEKKGRGKKGKWSLSSVKRWVMREKPEVKDTTRADALSNGGMGGEYPRRTLGYEGEVSDGVEQDGHSQPPWYPGMVAASTAAPLGVGTREEEWMGGQAPQPARPVYMRQRAHVS